MDYRPEFLDLTKPNDLLALKKHLSEMSDELDIIYTTTSPNGNISARQGRRAIYKNGSNYEEWINTTGSTVWVRTGGTTNRLWELDGTETQLTTADEIDMQSKNIINVTDPVSAQDAATKNSSETYANGKISKTTAGEIAAMTEKTTLVDADLFLIEDSAAGNAKKKVQRSNAIGNPLKLLSVTTISAANNSGDITLEANKLYKVLINITNFAADDSLALRFNNNTGANYSDVRTGYNDSPAAIGASVSAATSLVLSAVDTGANKTYFLGDFIVETTQIGTTNGKIFGKIMAPNSSGQVQVIDIAGYVANLGTDVTSFRILTTGSTNFTGKIYVYEMPLT